MSRPQWTTLWAILVGSVTSVSARELPRITISHPAANERMDPFAGLSVLGVLSPPLPLSIHVDILHVNDKGQLQRVFGASGIKTADGGQYQLTAKAPAVGWPSGNLRVVVRVDGLLQVSATRDVAVVQPREWSGGTMPHQPPRESSGVIMEFGDKPPNPAKRTAVPKGTLFLVRGELDPALAPFIGDVGPPVIGQIVESKGVIVQSGGCISLWDKESQRYWFELQLQAPDKPCEGVLRVRVQRVYERSTPIIIAEPVISVALR